VLVPVSAAPPPQRAQIVGTGLIGGSIGLGLRQRGWRVTGTDTVAARVERALELGAIDEIGVDAEALITFVATPAGFVVEAAEAALGHGGVVTDVAGVKAGIAAGLPHPRFVAGHPMAGSEQEGVDGADGDLFVGATWVLTPSEHTDADAYALVQAVVGLLGANVIAVSPDRHDALVAMISHVPHLTAATLMNLAADAALEDSTLLRLAAGGFRDMTRIAAGHPGIWPDVCVDNRTAILSVLDSLTSALSQVRRVVAESDRSSLLDWLERAREERINLPVGAPPPEETAELRVPVPDHPGAIAEVTTHLAELGVNVFDIEIAHSAEGGRGIMILAVDLGSVEVARKALVGLGYRVSARRISD
jgi:prephenate dehydrogenase